VDRSSRRPAHRTRERAARFGILTKLLRRFIWETRRVTLSHWLSNTRSEARPGAVPDWEDAAPAPWPGATACPHDCADAPRAPCSPCRDRPPLLLRSAWGTVIAEPENEGKVMPEPTTEPLDADEGGARAETLRAALVGALRADGKITSPEVGAAVGAVRRERFLPADTPLEIAYGVDSSVVTKRNERGESISSVSAAFIQARMLEQARLRPGMTVLEIGSGGLNAAMVSEVVGESGRVVSVDIDPEITERAARLLDENGYTGRVRVLVADAEDGVADEGPFDAIIVTVGAWDIAPAWLGQLAPGGSLVVPLIMNGVTRTVGFLAAEDHLISASTEVAGFVPMQGIGRHEDQVLSLDWPGGGTLRLRFDTGAPQDPGQLDGVLLTGPVEAWSDVTFPNNTSWADLYLWFACFLPGFCRLAADDDSELDRHGTWFPFGAVHGHGVAYFVTRPASDGAGVEFGARAYGRDGAAAAAAMVEQIRAWDLHGAERALPEFGYWPGRGDRVVLPAQTTAVLAKTHGVVTISWPAKG
jgi:protein-L-isoaspartate(D-aspartate) O-methyltransferase